MTDVIVKLMCNTVHLYIASYELKKTYELYHMMDKGLKRESSDYDTTINCSHYQVKILLQQIYIIYVSIFEYLNAIVFLGLQTFF